MIDKAAEVTGVVVCVILLAAMVAASVINGLKASEITLPVAPGVDLSRCDDAREVIYLVRDGQVVGCQVACR